MSYYLDDLDINVTVVSGDLTPNSSQVTITDSGGYFTSDYVEGALQEVGATLGALPPVSIPSVPSTLVERDVNNEINTSGIDFDTTHTLVDQVGRMKWNDTVGTAEIGLKGGNTTVQIGQETVLYCVNKTGVTIANGSVVNVKNAVGNMPSIILADSNGTGQERWVIGVATEDIANNSNGYVTIVGQVKDVNTMAFNEGDTIYLSTTAGQFTNVVPSPPATRVFIGWVLKKAGAGSIFVRPSKEPIPSEIKIEDAGSLYTATTVEGALQEVATNVNQKANKAQEAWITPTLLNGWLAFDVLSTPKYRKNTIGEGQLTGRVKSGTIGNNIFLLPLYYRPLHNCYFPILSNGVFSLIIVYTSGHVYVSGTANNTYVSLENIRFSVDV